MGGLASRNKGKRGEREVVNLLQPVINEVWSHFPQAGEPPLLQRNTLQSDRGGFDIVGLDWMAIEVKFQEQLNVKAWWEQCVRQAGISKVPVLFYRKSRMEWKVRLRVNLNIKRKWQVQYCTVEMELQEFLEFFATQIESYIGQLLEDK